MERHMKVTVRSGAFETNSSSMHSIVLDNSHSDVLTFEDICNEVEVDPSGYIWLYGAGEDFIYDRTSFTVLSSFKEKLKFMIASFCGSAETSSDAEEQLQKIANALHSRIGDINGIILPCEYENYMRDSRGYLHTEDEVLYDGEFNPYVVSDDGKRLSVHAVKEQYAVPIYGLVDHQSMHLLSHYLQRFHVSIADFLLDTKYSIVLDDDECWDKNQYSAILNNKSGFIYNCYDEIDGNKEIARKMSEE